MKVLVLTDLSVPHSIRWMEALIREGVDVFAVSLERPRFRVEFPHMVLPPVNPLFFKFRYLLRAKMLKPILHEYRPDIVNPHYVPNYGLMAALAAADYPIYLSMWGSDIIEVPRKSPIHRKITRWIIHKADRVMVDARMMADILRLDFDYPHDRIDIFPYGVEQDIRAQFKGNVRRRADVWHIVSHRRLDPDMDPLTLVRGFALFLRRSKLHAKLTLISDGSLREIVERECKRLGIAEDVRITGWLQKDDMVNVLLQGDIWVSASITDSTSVALLEAMAVGLFPVVSDLPANREWILDGINGLTFPLRSPERLAARLAEAVENFALRRHAIAINRRVIELHANWEANMHRLVSNRFNLSL